MTTTLAAAQQAVGVITSAGQIGGWRLTEQLGGGGFGTTWLATKKNLDGRLRKGVIKLTQPSVIVSREERDGSFGQHSFLQEFTILQQLRNAHIAEVFDGGIEEVDGVDVPWLALERIEGSNLAEDLAHGPLTEYRWLSLARDLFEALHVVHEAGLVHLDVKPANIMLRPRGAVLIDFGIAEQRGSEPSIVGGSPGYFAPEQLDDVLTAEDTAPAADMFKAGVTLVQAAILRNPWPKLDLRTPFDVQAKTLATAPDLDGLTPTQRSIVERLLAFDPAKRPSAEEMQDAAALALASTVVSGPAVTPPMNREPDPSAMSTIIRVTPPAPPTPPPVASSHLPPPVGPPRPVIPMASSRPLVSPLPLTPPPPRNPTDSMWTTILMVIGAFGILGASTVAVFIALPEWNYVVSGAGRIYFNSPGVAAFIVLSHLLIYATVIVGVTLRRKTGRSTFWVPLSGGGLAALLFLIAFVSFTLSAPLR